MDCGCLAGDVEFNGESALSMLPNLEAGVDRYGQSWKGRVVAVVGLGRSGMAAATLLRQAGAEVSATDARSAKALHHEIQLLAKLGITRIEVNGHTESSLDGADWVVVSPGVGEKSGPVAWARTKGVPVISEIELAFLFCPSPVVAVTGTNGKSTAVTLIAEILKSAGRKAIACGNLGTPFSSVVPQLAAGSFAVVEVSSFQLLHCRLFHPMIGVLLNIGTNHLDRHEDARAYLTAKARLFQAQLPSDHAVLNACEPKIVALSDSLCARRIWFGRNQANPRRFRLAEQTLAAFPENMQAVLQVSRLLGIADALSWQVIRSFRGLEHRLESVDTLSGVHFVNDSKSTTPESLLYALNRTLGPVVAIIGGRDKGMDFETLVKPLTQDRVRGVVLIGESRARLRPLFNGSPKICESETLESAVKTAAELAGPGGTVLFSPACASFDMFRDFEERGRVFKSIVEKMDEGIESDHVAVTVSDSFMPPVNGMKFVMGGRYPLGAQKAAAAEFPAHSCKTAA